MSFRRWALNLIVLAAVCAAVSASYWYLFLSHLPPSRSELSKIIYSARPIISTLDRYGRDNGRPPAALQDLVPKYLSSIPKAGGPVEGTWSFSSSETANHDPNLKRGQWRLAVKVAGTVGGIAHFGDSFEFRSDGRYDLDDPDGERFLVDGWGYMRE